MDLGPAPMVQTKASSRLALLVIKVDGVLAVAIGAVIVVAT